jgi:hypothetical protein
MGWAVCSDDDAVSETLGYILIFMIVLSCIAFILLAGNGVLDATKSQNNFKSMEQGLTVVSSDLKQVALEGTPVKTTRIHMEGGSISAKADTNEMTISFDETEVYDEDMGNIRFMSDTDSSIVSLENGGVWDRQGVNSGNIVVLKPRFYMIIDPDTNAQTLVLNVIKLDANPPSAIGGSTTMDIKLMDKGTNVLTYDDPTGKDVEVTFYTDYPDAWARFFQENGANYPPLEITSDHVKVKFQTISKLVISEHTVGVSID